MFGTALVGTAANETKAAAVRLARYTAIYAVVAGLIVVAAAYASGAAYIYLSQIYGAVEAGLMLSGVFIILAILALASTLLLKKKHKVETRQRVTTEASSIATMAAVSAIPALLRHRNLASSAGVIVPLTIAAGMYMWARSSDGSLDDLKKYVPGLRPALKKVS